MTSSDRVARVPHRNRAWIWFFLTLAVLAVVAITFLWLAKSARQLKPEQLEMARSLWETKGSHDYDMKYTQKVTAPDTYRVDIFQVRVRHNQVVSVVLNGEPRPKEFDHYSDMPALFDAVADFLKYDAQSGRPRTFSTATFDPGDGHLIRYFRKVLGTSEQQEISVQLAPPADDESSGTPE
jgi:hypothetical protein